MEDPLVLVARADSELAKHRSLTLEELAEIPVLTYRQCRRTAQLSEEMQNRGLRLQLRHPSDDNNTLLALAAAGVGASFVPRLAIEPAYLDVSISEIELPIEPRVIVRAWYQDRPLTAGGKRFVTIAGRVCAAIEKSDGRSHLAAVPGGS
jgi:DNA-binding transcriptional LysR family regulator